MVGIVNNKFSTEHLDVQLNDLFRTIDAETGRGKVFIEYDVWSKRIVKAGAEAKDAPGTIVRIVERFPRRPGE